MFGLMKFKAKAPAALPAQHQRLHYCGVCKAMGRQYGQRTRAMLNYDAIFLSELLTFLGPAPANYHREWSPALLSYNCMRLPKTEGLPEALKYAAAVNVLLAGVKLEDNVQDKGGFLWRTASKLYSERVAKAENDLRAYGLDLEAVDGWLREHARREQEEWNGGKLRREGKGGGWKRKIVQRTIDMGSAEGGRDHGRSGNEQMEMDGKVADIWMENGETGKGYLRGKEKNAGVRRENAAKGKGFARRGKVNAGERKENAKAGKEYGRRKEENVGAMQENAETGNEYWRRERENAEAKKEYASREIEQERAEWEKGIWKQGNGDPKSHLMYMAEATAEITALVFRQGAIAMGRGEEQGKMEMLGRDFGKMIYLLDAWRDFEKDHKKGEYNPIREAWGVEGREMPMAVREEMQGKLLRIGRHMLETLQALPFTEAQKTWFRDRIEENLREQLGLSAEEVRACTTAPAKKPRRKISLATRWQFLNNLARTWHLPKIRNRSGYWRTAFTFGSVGLLALFFPTFLHAKADWFTHIDPDFLSRFGDLHPDWINETANDCCCQGPNGRCCCDTCCNNCQRECNETCNRIITVFLTIAALFLVGIIAMIVFIVQGSRRAARKEAERHNAHLANSQPRQSNFRTVLHRPGRDPEVLLAAAHDWFQRHIPGSMPQLRQSENHRSLYAKGRITLRQQVLGQVEFRAQIHVREGALALEFEDFEHVGGPECLAGGPLSQRMPANAQPPMNADAWRSIKDQVATEIRAKLGSFGSEV